LEERHRKTYRSVSVNKDLAELMLKKAARFLNWVKDKIKRKKQNCRCRKQSW